MEELIKPVGNVDENGNQMLEVNIREIFKNFIPPRHINCKDCYGTGRIGYTYDPKTKKRGNAIPCPKMVKEFEDAQNLYISNLEPEKRNIMAAVIQAQKEGRLMEVPVNNQNTEIPQEETIVVD